MMKRMHRKKLSLAITQALSAGIFVGLAAPSYGQQPAPPAGGYSEKITVTGTRIPSPNLDSTSPINIITPQDIKFEHPVSTENLLNNMPQVFAEFGNMQSNGATGTATVDLRGIGSNRTLVLVNGRRLPPGSPLLYAADINQIPLPLIQRVDIYTGGASSVYGSDAVAGVVNFIMNDRFQGVQFDWGHSFYNHQQGNSFADIVAGNEKTNPANFHVPGDVDSDGEVETYSVTMGGDFANGKGNAVVFMGYERTHPVLQANRDFSACAAGSTATTLNCTGSGTSFPGKFTNLNDPNFTAYTIKDSSGGVRPFSSATDTFNFGPYNFFQRPDERYSVAAYAKYDVAPSARVYTEFNFHDDHSLAQIAPSGDFGNEYALSFDNPLLSSAFKSTFGITPTTPGDVIIQRRNVEGGGRLDDLRHTSYRGVFGVKGEVPFAPGWDYDVWYQMGKVLLQETYRNDFSNVRLARAYDVVSDPTTGQPVCRSALEGTDPNCVPYNVFKLGGVTQAALNYLQTPGFEKGFTEQSIVGATVSADLGMYGWKMPWAKDGLGVAFGLERRVEKLEFETDNEFSTGDLAGQGGVTLPLSGRYTVKEAYAEVKVPLIQDRPGAQLVSINGSYRYSDYDTGHTTNTWGVGAEWAPIKEVRLRGSYQRAIRAANIIELFQAQGLNLFGMDSDPCGGPTPSATLAQCLRTGLPANLYGSNLLTNPAGQYNFLQGGNPALDPESAKSYTLGAVFTPMRNFSASIDYFNIEVKNVVGIVPSALAVSQCVAAGLLCDLIHRDGNGTLWLPGGGFVTGTNLNLARDKTSGFDFTGNYTQPVGAWGSVGLNFVGTYLKEFIFEPVPGLGSYDCAGLFGPTCGAPAPVWRHRLRGTWSTPWNVDLALTWRHVNKVKLDATDGNPLLAGPFNAPNAELASRDYMDLAASWALTKSVTLWAGVNNVFDKDPPIVSNTIADPAIFGNGNTWPQAYDALGRRIFISLTAKF